MIQIDDLIETEIEAEVEEDPGLSAKPSRVSGDDDISSLLSLHGEEYHGLQLLFKE